MHSPAIFLGALAAVEGFTDGFGLSLALTVDGFAPAAGALGAAAAFGVGAFAAAVVAAGPAEAAHTKKN